MNIQSSLRSPTWNSRHIIKSESGTPSHLSHFSQADLLHLDAVDTVLFRRDSALLFRRSAARQAGVGGSGFTYVKDDDKDFRKGRGRVIALFLVPRGRVRTENVVAKISLLLESGPDRLTTEGVWPPNRDPIA